MEKVFKKAITTIVLPTIVFGITACATTSNSSVDNDGDSRRVGNVVWNNQVDTDINTILKEQVATDEARLVFIRKNDSNPEQTSANIAVNNRFQVSLQAGNYTVVNSCVGTNQLSAYATGFKSNNLLADKNTYELMGGQTYFFDVEMDEMGKSALKQIASNDASQLLANKRYQTHQISRVVTNCSAPVVVVTPRPVTPPPTIRPRPLVLEKTVTIDLEVLFETDKAVVKPEYYAKVAEVAEFMMQYPNTMTTIEGHTDSRGSDSYNQALSQRRVDAVREVLITRFGIADDRLKAIGYGESQPKATNDNAEGRQLNRRVVAVVEERLGN
ncbi:OmpA family protein [Psychrobacter sp. DAB_AL43B]|uniref:OmpA family protein n=1 Tax=Psychrobacter sp. DAB_AL43B TaxID=1028416 RepID=UPI0009A6BA7B|nr:OmpA family protein [Psychrobacter sp. DAB_AL43B]SLJ84760.1 Outer membrane porin F [Psychrobacter sp. DAB_AL43B]